MINFRNEHCWLTLENKSKKIIAKKITFLFIIKKKSIADIDKKDNNNERILLKKKI